MAPRVSNSSMQHAGEYRCSVGGEWKPLVGFSKRYQKQCLNKHNVDRANSGMICREHSGEPILEMHCEGPCNMTKSLDAFSKNNRRNGVNWCIACQGWANAQEHGEIPFAAPNQPMDVLEQQVTVDFPLAPEAYLKLKDEDLLYDDSDNDEPLAPFTHLSNEADQANDGSNATVPSTSGKSLPSQFGCLSIGDQASRSPRPRQHNSNASVSTATTVRNGRVPYNAWDPAGGVHVRDHAATDTATEAGTSVSGLPESIVLRPATEPQPIQEGFRRGKGASYAGPNTGARNITAATYDSDASDDEDYF